MYSSYDLLLFCFVSLVYASLLVLFDLLRVVELGAEGRLGSRIVFMVT